MSSSGQQRELVFCHECENEWYREEHGLSCPDCHSDFVEVIEPNHDPRALPVPSTTSDVTTSWRELNNHNPWANLESEEGNTARSSSTFPDSTASPNVIANRGVTPFNPIGQQVGAFTSVFNGMMGIPSNMPGPLFGGPGRQVGSADSPRSQSVPGSWPEGRGFGATSRPSGTRFEFFSNGPNYTFTTTMNGRRVVGGSNVINGAGSGDVGPIDLSEVVTQIFSNLAGQNLGREGGPSSPFAHIIGMLGNPANMQMGDAVFSNEAFDRVVSQFMEQHQSSNAPGPASASAIAALPKKKASMDMLDPVTGTAECSICMDTIKEGTVVTKLPCTHWFDPPCIESWLKEHDTCPVCRAGITPRDGDRNTVRTPTQAPLHSLAETSRRQSGSRQNPFVVPESPSRERRQPTLRRHSSASTDPNSFRRPSTRNSSGSVNESGGGGITERVKRWFGGDGSNGAGGAASSSSRP